jgi:hypothetical protein
MLTPFSITDQKMNNISSHEFKTVYDRLNLFSSQSWTVVGLAFFILVVYLNRNNADAKEKFIRPLQNWSSRIVLIVLLVAWVGYSVKYSFYTMYFYWMRIVNNENVVQGVVKNLVRQNPDSGIRERFNIGPTTFQYSSSNFDEGYTGSLGQRFAVENNQYLRIHMVGKFITKIEYSQPDNKCN